MILGLGIGLGVTASRLWRAATYFRAPAGASAAGAPRVPSANGPAATGPTAGLGARSTPPSATEASTVLIAPGVHGVWTGTSWAYWLEAPLGPVLVDAGADPNASALAAALAEGGHALGEVRAVLLTHGHADHTAGLAALPAAEVYVGLEDATLARGDTGPQAWPYVLAARLGARRREPRDQHLVTPGEVVQVAGAAFRVLPLPGHTAGSVAYLYADGAFVGDAAVPGPGGTLKPLPWPCNARQGMARAVVERLSQRPLRWLAFGHAPPRVAQTEP